MLNQQSLESRLLSIHLVFRQKPEGASSWLAADFRQFCALLGLLQLTSAASLRMGDCFRNIACLGQLIPVCQTQFSPGIFN